MPADLHGEPMTNPHEFRQDCGEPQMAMQSKLAQTAQGKYELVKAYMMRHAEEKLSHSSVCYRHHPDHSNLLPKKYTMDKLEEDLRALPAEDCEAISHMWNLFGTASGRQRQIIMRGMLSQCCFPQLSDVSTTVKELLRIDFVISLPVELAFKVLGYLDAKSLSMASMVSKGWQQLANDDVVWYHLCEQHIDRKCTTCGWGLPLLERRRLRQSKQAVMQRLECLSTNSTGLADSVSSGAKRSSNLISGSGEVEPKNSKFQCTQTTTRPWKDVYIERFKIEQNWRMGHCSVKDFRHPSPVLCLQFDEQHLMTGTCDGLVTIWDVETKKLVRQLHGHIRGVSALKFDSTKLVTGSWDQSIRVWNYRTGQCLCTFGGHESKILCIDFDSNLIAAGGVDASIKIWDFVTKSCFTLRGHRAAVHSVRIHKSSNTLFTSSEDLTVRMWCLSSKKCIRIFGGPENGPHAHVAQIQYALPVTLEHLEGDDEHDHHVLSAESASDDEGSNGYSATEIPASVTASTATSSSDLQPQNVFGLGEVNNFDAVHNHFKHHHPGDENHTRATRPTHLLTASLDNTIKLWDIQTGRCARTLFGHIEGVWCIAADHFRIVSGAHDKLVKVWDVQSGKCWHTYSGHTKPVCCVGLTDTAFASGGDDGLVRLRSFDV